MHVQAPKVGVRVVYRLACHLRTTLSRLLNFLPITGSSPLMVNKCTYHSFLSVSRAWFPLLPLNYDQRLFRLGHAQSDKTNRTGQKKSFALFPFHVQIFQVLRNFFCSEINQASFVSHIDLSGLSHIFTEWLPRSLKRPKGKQTLVLFSKQELMGFGSVFDCVGFSLGLWDRVDSFFDREYFFKKTSVSDRRKTCVGIRLNLILLRPQRDLYSHGADTPYESNIIIKVISYYLTKWLTEHSQQPLE